MSITRNFNLFLNAGHGSPLVINVNQYDRGEQWVFTLYNGDGSQYVPSTGAIVGIKSDGLGIVNTGSVVDGKVVIAETQQMTAAVGKSVFELMIDSQTHGTANFIVLVEPKPGDNADLSESDLSLIQEAIDSTSPVVIADTVSEWLEDNITPTTPAVDASLTVAGAAADAKATGDRITALENRSGSGLTADIKQALLDIFAHTAFADTNGQTYYDALETALYPPANLVSITAVFNQGSAVIYDNDSLDTLKQYLTVTAHYDNAPNAVVTDYVLSGQLTAGTSTITATYGGKTATFNVTVTGTYVTDGLTHKWDAINNTHDGHASNATLWADLVGSNDLEMPSNALCTWTDNALQCGVGYLDCIGGQIDTGVATVEVVISDAPASATGCIVQFGSVSRCCALFTDHTFTMKASQGTTYATGFTDDSNVHSLVAVYSENSAAGSYYVNGQPAVAGSATHSITPQYTDRMRVGANSNNTANYKYTGKIHAIRIYNRALTANEIAQNYSFDVSRFGLGE